LDQSDYTSSADEGKKDDVASRYSKDSSTQGSEAGHIDDTMRGWFDRRLKEI
jgi:hypothetical protein